ncbi:minor tail protein [Arthrobacter phage Zucker]|nr:minor tail protein [Arthrobacter phage Zucker]
MDEVQFAALIPRYSVVGPEDFKATTQAGDRIVAIGNGTALGPGTIDVASSLPPIQFNAASGTRWDLVALRRDWQPPGGTTSVVIIEGGTSQAYPTVGTATNQWNRRPGIVDDQPLYLQQVNGTLLGERIDLRCWAGNNGLFAVHNDARTYLQNVGTEVLINGIRWHYSLGANNVPAWTCPDEPTFHSPLPISGYSITGDITTTPEGSKRRVTVDLNVARTGNAGVIPNDEWANFGAVIPTAARGDAAPKYVPVSLIGGAVSTATNNLHATVFLNPANGLMQIRGVNAFTWQKGALFSLNLSYVI